MSRERAVLLEQLRAELVGPGRIGDNWILAKFESGSFVDTRDEPWGRLFWEPDGDDQQELISWRSGRTSETPWSEYAMGVLWPESHDRPEAEDEANTFSPGADAGAEDDLEAGNRGRRNIRGGSVPHGEEDPGDNDFEVTSADARRPSTMGISFCVAFDGDSGGAVVVSLPREKRFHWQNEDSRPFPVNGHYTKCGEVIRRTKDGKTLSADAWGRRSVLTEDVRLIFPEQDFRHNRPICREVEEAERSGLKLVVELFPRRLGDAENAWLCTVVLRNRSQTQNVTFRERMLFQAFFEAGVEGGILRRYPEGQRPFHNLDEDEQSMRLLYRDSAVWGIGHGCAAAWNGEPGETPERIMADVFPVVELPSMTPDITTAEGDAIPLRMRDLAEMPEDGAGPAWDSLRLLAREYERWIEKREGEVASLPEHLQAVAGVHLKRCRQALDRIRCGIGLLRNDPIVWRAFRLANLSMLLQQIAQKELDHRGLVWQGDRNGWAVPEGEYRSPWEIYQEGNKDDIGSWRAFQLAFLLMSLQGIVEDDSEDRRIVDLIWFPTGGGKTEAYLGLMAFSMFHQRLSCGEDEVLAQQASGTHVIMRYTLRMLTAQQFQRAASLICAMEFLRRHPEEHNHGSIPGDRFSLGLWIGGSATANTLHNAQQEFNDYQEGRRKENPLVLGECPWCRAAIGRYEGAPPQGINRNAQAWRVNIGRIGGLRTVQGEGPLLGCSDKQCEFGGQYADDLLPIEVIDERIYRKPPSLLVSTVDKFAMLAWRPDAGSLFGRELCPSRDGLRRQVRQPPKLFIQDELHLISGPLGTMYALYEGVFERLCSERPDGTVTRPKIVAATATIRGAGEQVKSLYDRDDTRLFPPPGLEMGDSFFGQYARCPDNPGRLARGRMYVGIHAENLPSMMTAQARTFAGVLHASGRLPEESDARDPWWTLLAFYNSIRELGGALTLFHSDIPARLSYLSRRDGIGHQQRRYVNRVEELTSRLNQSQIVRMMERLSTEWTPDENRALDACLASSIIEVGVDIVRLSLMAVVGQPKSTAQYIQVTGRVGRDWKKRPGLILSLYNPGKSRDRSHYEQFHGYHRRLYEQVEPTTATPFALSAIVRGLPGAIIAWARQHGCWEAHEYACWEQFVQTGLELLKDRCRRLEPERAADVFPDLDRVAGDLIRRWQGNPQGWEAYPPRQDIHYLMLWPGQYYSPAQRGFGVLVSSSMRSVDSSGRLEITPQYAMNGEEEA